MNLYQTINQINQALAEQAGIDIGIIQAGLKAVKDQQDFDNALRLSQEERLKKSSEFDNV